MVNRRFLIILCLVLLSPSLLLAQAPTLANAQSLVTPASQELKTPDKDLVIIQTNIGAMTMRLFPKAAPKMVANFKNLVRTGFYNETKFHRVIPGFMIQGGDYMTKLPDKSKWGMGRANEKTIPAEFHPELHHVPGIVSAARMSDPNSASTQFFICVGTPSHLDGQYTIFGELTDEASLEVAKKISQLQRDPGDHPLTDVIMKKVFIKSTGPTAGEATKKAAPPQAKPKQ